MGKSKSLLYATVALFGASCFLSGSNEAFGYQFQTSSTSTTSDSTGTSAGSGQQSTSFRLPSVSTTEQSSPSSGTTDQGPYIDSGGIRRPMTQTEMQIYERNRRWREMLAEPETDFQKMARHSLGEKLQVYGRKLFLDGPGTFTPIDQTPVTPDYLIGPGDELLVRTWGQISFNDHLTVDRSGDIFIPRVGSVHVAGLPYSSLETTLRKSVSRVFRNFDLIVNMGQLRSIQIFVVGQAAQPGSYTVNSLSTLVTAVFAAGGPSNQGSMRHVQLRRNNQVMGEFDFYDLLARGDKSKDLHLLAGDVIYIPPVGPQVALGGAVKNAAIYELKDESTTVSQLLEIAGGPSTTSTKSDLLIERVAENSDREAMRVSLDSTGLATPLRNGDILRISALTQRFTQAVTLRGNVASPGRFAWHSGMKLSELLPEKEALLTNNYWQRRNALGLPAPMFEPLKKKTIPVVVTSNPLGEITATNVSPSATSSSSSSNVRGQIGMLTLGKNPSQGEGNTPDIEGRQDESEAAPGMQPEGDFQNSPTSQNGVEGSGNSSQSSPGSSLAAASAPNSQFPRRVDVKMAAPEVDWSYAVIERLDQKTLKNKLLSFNLGKLVLDHDESQNLELQPGDVVTIFSQGDVRVPIDEQTKYIRLEGEFVGAGVYSALPGETLRQLVARAGGLTRNAYLYGSQFTRESTRRVQQQRLDEYTARLTAELQRSAINQMTAGTGTSSQDSGIFAAMQASQQQMLQRLGQIRASGRVVLGLHSDSRDLTSIPDLALENGDIFVVPSTPSSVNVVGAVYDQNSFVYNNRRTVGDYLKLSGGPNRSADRKHAFVIRADGSVYSYEAAKGIWGNEFKGAHVYPGDTIIVPEKVFNPSGMRQFLQWSQMISSLAMGAATIGILANQ